jgi:hypothetical protein
LPLIANVRHVVETLHLGSQAEFVRITVPPSFNREAWAQVTFEVSVQCFRGTVQAFIERSDLEQLLQSLAPLYKSLRGRAELSPLEAQISLVLLGNGRGAIAVSGFALSQASFGSKLQFEFELDQTYLPSFIADLQTLLAKTDGGHA